MVPHKARQTEPMLRQRPQGRRPQLQFRRSEQELYRQLDLPRRSHDRGDLPRIGEISSVTTLGVSGDSTHRCEGVQTRNPEVGVVEDIEDLRPELRAQSLENLRILREQEIRGCIPRSCNRVLTQVAYRSGSRKSEAVLVEPVVRRLTGGYIGAPNQGRKLGRKVV